jgi:RNA recognition motif-containing protein
MNIYIGNLPNEMTENELKSIFAEFGEVHSTKIINDRETGRSRGFGFVEMSENAGRKAISELKDVEYEGRTLTVNESKPKTQGFGGNDSRRRSW